MQKANEVAAAIAAFKSFKDLDLLQNERLILNNAAHASFYYPNAERPDEFHDGDFFTYLNVLHRAFPFTVSVLVDNLTRFLRDKRKIYVNDQDKQTFHVF